MLRIAWLTDIHLNFVDAPHLAQFLADLAAVPADGFFLSGDIGEARDVVEYLTRLDDALQRPIYFVLGNHDFYFGSISRVRAQVGELCAQRPRLKYLTFTSCWPIGKRSAVLGHDGWADGREGDYLSSYVMMNDYKLIAELAPYRKAERWEHLKALGDESADHLRRVLPPALARHEHVYLVTHVPPFRSACWYDGRISDDEWAPHFTCQAMGTAILEIMRDHPTRQLTVVCGHTHGSGESRPADNVEVLTGGALYGQPALTRVFEIA